MRQFVIAAASFGATAMICRPLFRMVLSGVARNLFMGLKLFMARPPFGVDD